MNARQVYQALRPLIDEALQRVANQTATVVIGYILDALENRQQGGVGSTLGATASFTLPAITRTPPLAGNFVVSAYGTVTASVPGDPVSITLQRGGAPIGPTEGEIITDAAGNLAFAIGPFVDPAGTGAHVYSVKVTNATGGHTVDFESCSVLAQETFP